MFISVFFLVLVSLVLFLLKYLGVLHLVNLFNSLALKIFRGVSFVHVHSREGSKLDPKALWCIFLDYSPTQKGYKYFHPPIKEIFLIMEVIFFEDLSYHPRTYLLVCIQP